MQQESSKQKVANHNSVNQLSEPRERSRSRQRNDQKQMKIQERIQKSDITNKVVLQAGQMHYDQYVQKQQEFHQNQQMLRSFLRIEQGRQQPIDKFVKVLYTYKGKYQYDSKIKDLMTQPKKYLNKLSITQLDQMLEPGRRYLANQEKFKSKYIKFWETLMKLIDYKLKKKKQSKQQQSLEVKQKIKKMLDKPITQLSKLDKKIEIMLKNASFGVDMSYWQKIKSKVRGKLLENQMIQFYEQFKVNMKSQDHNAIQQQTELRQPISPILGPYNLVNPKLIMTEEQQLDERKSLDAQIFRYEFQKHKQKLEENLSLPKNHNLLTKDFKNQNSNTYDLITQQIMEFEKYKRMEADQQQFDDRVPIETEGRFRDRVPEYINRVRISCDWTRYGQSGIIKQKLNKDNQPPPKQVQGYKFNIFYPDLYDKQKTPQYYFEAMQDPNMCLIKFKAGPPYKDIAFKILRKQWDFTEKSGFEAIFTKGILQLYFNFKKPKYRI